MENNIPHHHKIQRRYEALGAVNDLLIALWFLVGSFFFLNSALVEKGTWLFIVGSAQLFIKPGIKLAGLLHTKRARGQSGQSQQKQSGGE